jgi:hypothetical protein
MRSLLDWLGWERLSETRARHKQTIDLLILMAKTQTQVNADLKALSLQSDKIAAEQAKRFDDLTAVIVKLTEQINAGEVTPEVEASLAELQTKLQSLDDTIPDAPPA